MSTPRFVLAIVTIIVIALNVLHIKLDASNIVAMSVIVPFLTAAIYRAFTVFGK